MSGGIRSFCLLLSENYSNRNIIIMNSAQERAEEMMKALESSSIFGEPDSSGGSTNEDMEKYLALQKEEIDKKLNKIPTQTGRLIDRSQKGSLVDGFSSELKPILIKSMKDLETLTWSILDNSVSQENLQRCFESSTASQQKADEYAAIYAKKIFQLTADIGEEEKVLSTLENQLSEVALKESTLNGHVSELAKEMEKQKGKEEQIMKDLDDNKKAVMGKANPKPGLGVVISSMKTAAEIERIMRERMAIQNHRHKMKVSMDKLQNDLKRLKSEMTEISKQKMQIKGKIHNLNDRLLGLCKERDLIVEFGFKIKTIALFLGQWKGKIDVAQNFNKNGIYLASLGASVRDLLEFLASSREHVSAIASLMDCVVISQLLAVFSQNNLPPLNEFEEF